MDLTWPLFVYFHPFLNTMKHKYSKKLTRNGKSIDGVLGIRTLDHSMVGIDESTEVLRTLIIE